MTKPNTPSFRKHKIVVAAVMAMLILLAIIVLRDDAPVEQPSVRTAENQPLARGLTDELPEEIAAPPVASIPAAVTVQTNLPPAVRRERIARLDDIMQERGAELILNLFADVTATVTVENPQALGEGRAIWFGKVAGVEGSEFILAREGDVVAATVFIPPHGQYEIRYNGDGRHIVREIDSEKVPQCGADRHPAEDDAAGDEPAESSGTPSSSGDAGGTNIDIMVVYTAQARTAAGGTSGIHTVIDLAVAQANLSYQNSQINAQLNLVYRGEVSYTESGSMNTDLDRVTSGSDGHMDDVQSLRNAYGADMVSLFTSTGESGYAGIAWVMCNPGSSFANYAYSVVRQQYATSHTFAHEVGHNLGCSHDHDNGGCGAYAYSYGHRFTASNGFQYRTVMAYAPGQRISYFSNPNVTYLGTATGVAGTGADAANNAQSINNTVSIVANFRTATTTTPPSAPTTLAASAASSSQINLGWQDNSNNETGFTLQRGSSSSGPWTTVATTSANATSYSNTGLSATTAYYYRLFAINSAGNSATTSVANATTTAAPDTTAPSVPGSLTATVASSSQINLAWQASSDTGGSGLAGYKVFRNSVQVATTTSTSYSATGLSAATAYCFTVAAYDNAGNNSTASSQACATTSANPPATPASLTATAASYNRINLSWQDHSSNETGFRVERAPTSGGSWSQIATTTANATTYADTSVTGSSPYYYRVRAYNSGGNSSYTSVASATTPAAPDVAAPSVPTGLSATAASSVQIDLEWNASNDSGGSGLAGYRIYRDGEEIGTSSIVSFSAPGLSPGTEYCFKVAAYDNAGNESAQSTEACATTLPAGSPVGTWEVTMRGATKGTAFLTFTEDFAIEGYGMLNGYCGYYGWEGTWAYDEAGKVVGTFTRANQEAACGMTNAVAGSIAMTVNSRGQLRGRGVEDGSVFTWRGVTATEHLDLSGNWNATLVKSKVATPENYALGTATISSLYSVDGEADDASYPVTGMVMITARNQLLGYLVRHETSGNLVSLYTGKATTTLRLKGSDTLGVRHKLTAVAE